MRTTDTLHRRMRGRLDQRRALPSRRKRRPQLVQDDGHEYLLLKQSDLPGMTFAEVKDVPLPGILETTGQLTFDDKKVSTIVSRVQGRIEDIRASLWDTVVRGEPIAKLYSPDFMTAEAEYLQALTTVKVSTGSSIDGGPDLAASMANAAQAQTASCSGWKRLTSTRSKRRRRPSGCARRSAASW